MGNQFFWFFLPGWAKIILIFFLCFSTHNLGSIPQIAFFGVFCKTCYALRRGVCNYVTYNNVTCNYVTSNHVTCNYVTCTNNNHATYAILFYQLGIIKKLK